MNIEQWQLVLSRAERLKKSIGNDLLITISFGLDTRILNQNRLIPLYQKISILERNILHKWCEAYSEIAKKTTMKPQVHTFKSVLENCFIGCECSYSRDTRVTSEYMNMPKYVVHTFHTNQHLIKTIAIFRVIKIK